MISLARAMLQERASWASAADGWLETAAVVDPVKKFRRLRLSYQDRPQWPWPSLSLIGDKIRCKLPLKICCLSV